MDAHVDSRQNKKRKLDIKNSDQGEGNLGIRDIDSKDSEDGKYVEAETGSPGRRDSEESRYNEAGQLTPSALEGNPEGGKISESLPQESL